MRTCIIIVFSIFITFACGFSCKKSKLDSGKTNYVRMSVSQFSDNWTCSIDPGNSSNFDIGKFRLWVPDSANTSALRGILVVLQNFNGNSIGMEKFTEWRNYAIANNLAIMTAYLIIIDYDNADQHTYYWDARNGSGDALLLALEAITNRNNISNVAALPFLIRGYSAGGMFSYYFSAFKPERVIAISNIRGWILQNTPDENKNVAALFLQGELDTAQMTPREIGDMERIVKDKRAAKGIWAYAREPGVNHFDNLEKSDELTRQFFSAVLNKRVSPGSNQLISLAETSGWLGDHDSKDIFPYDAYAGNKARASWLVDKDFATAWSAYQKK